MKKTIITLVVVSFGLGVALLLQPAKPIKPTKAYFNVQLNTGEYWACYPRPERNLVPLCVPREVAP